MQKGIQKYFAVLLLVLLVFVTIDNIRTQSEIRLHWSDPVVLGILCIIATSIGVFNLFKSNK